MIQNRLIILVPENEAVQIYESQIKLPFRMLREAKLEKFYVESMLVSLLVILKNSFRAFFKNFCALRGLILLLPNIILTKKSEK